jgi:hypothetical protein
MMDTGLDLAAVYTDLHANPELGSTRPALPQWSPPSFLRQASM